MKLVLLVLAASLVSSASARAGLLLSAGAPAGPVDVSGGPVTVIVPLYIEQTGPTTVIATAGLYSVGAAVSRTAGTAEIADATRFNANFGDANNSVDDFTATGALFKVQRTDVDGITSATGKLQFGTLSLSLAAAGTSSFTLGDNDVAANVTDTLDGGLEPLDALITGSTFSITATTGATVPEPTTLGLALVASTHLFRRTARR